MLRLRLFKKSQAETDAQTTRMTELSDPSAVNGMVYCRCTDIIDMVHRKACIVHNLEARAGAVVTKAASSNEPHGAAVDTRLGIRRITT